MTTIAYDGRYLAADRMITRDSDFPTIAGYESKFEIIRRPCMPDRIMRTYVAVASGWMTDCNKFFYWIKAWAMAFDQYPQFSDHFTGIALIETEGKPVLYKFTKESGGLPQVLDPSVKFALGAGGREYAEGCMSMGACAPYAVELASKICPFTGGGVQFVDSQNDIGKLWTLADGYTKPVNQEPFVIFADTQGDGRSWATELSSAQALISQQLIKESANGSKGCESARDDDASGVWRPPTEGKDLPENECDG